MSPHTMQMLVEALDAIGVAIVSSAVILALAIVHHGRRR